MSIIIGLVVATLFAWFGASAIKKHTKVFYIGAIVLSVIAIAVTWTGADLTFPTFVQNNIWSILARGALGTAIFMIVMMTGALKNGSDAIKRLMPIRAELSIIASILILGHNISYGKTYFVFLFTMTKYMPVTQILAAISSIIMIVIMVPLMIMSFPKIRKKMNAVTWKKIQRLAYVFYALTYIHVLLLCIPQLSSGKIAYLASIIVYSVVCFVYLYMRLKKALLIKKATRTKWVPVLCVVLAAAVCAMTGGSWTAHAPDRVLLASAENAKEQENDFVEEGLSAEEEQMEEEVLTAETEEDMTEEEVVETEEEVVETETDKTTETDESNTNATKKETASSNTQSSNGESSNTSNSGTTSSGSSDTGSSETSAPQAPTEPEVVVPTTVYKDGTFTGTAYGYKSNVTMSVTISNDKITNVSVVSQGEDAMYWTMAKDVIGRIQSSQSPYVDAVSGATISSNAIMNAVANALASARN